MASLAPLRDVTSGLRAFRRRIRGLFLTHAVARIVLAAALGLVVFFAADLLLDLPLGVRRFVRLGLLGSPALFPGAPLLAVVLGLLALLLARGGRAMAGWTWFLAAGLGGWLAWWSWRALGPLLLRLPDERLALEVERGHPDLKDRVASALDFAREVAQPGRLESVPMMQAVVNEAAREAHRLPFARVASGRTALAWAGSAALALVVALVVFALDPSATRLWARRSLLAEDVAWPRASEVLAVAVAEDGSDSPWPPERAFEVAVGRSLAVHARVRGKPVDEVLLLDLAEGQLPLPRRMFPVAGRAGLYAVELTNVRQGFRFVVRGGDDDDDLPVYRVEATVPPGVLDIGAELSFPAYLGRAAERVDGGSLSVPQGTQVRVTFSATVPLSEARALLGDTVLPCERATGEGGVDGGGEVWRFGFTAERPLRYRLLLRTAAGRENDPSADGYDMAVEEDRRPRAEWLWPRAGMPVTPKGRVPLIARTLDDHAVVDLRLELRVGADGAPIEVELRPRAPEAASTPLLDRDGRRSAEANDGPAGRAQVLTYLPLDLETLAPPGGFTLPASLAVRLVAKDSKGQSGESPWQSLEILGAPELERELAGRRSALRTSVDALRVEQQAREEQTRAAAQGPLTEAERDQLKSVQFAQGRIQQHAERAVRDFLEIFAAFVLDRLGSEHPNERILAMFDRHHRRTYGVAPAGAAGAAGPATDDPVFPYALFDEIVEAWRGRTLLDNGVLDRMCAVLVDAMEVAVRLAPQAQAAAVRAASGGPAEIAALGEAQRALLAALTRLLSTMGDWANLSDVIVNVRRVLEEQKELLQQLDQDLNPSQPKAPGGSPPSGPPSR